MEFLLDLKIFLVQGGGMKFREKGENFKQM